MYSDANHWPEIHSGHFMYQKSTSDLACFSGLLARRISLVFAVLTGCIGMHSLYSSVFYRAINQQIDSRSFGKNG